MQNRMRSGAVFLLAAETLAACQVGGDMTARNMDAGVCRPEAASALVGMDRLTDTQAMQMTGATRVRQTAPGQGVTMDYRRERVTIVTDPGTGKITRASCG